MRKTKIISTLGPATDSAEIIEKLIHAGVNVFRLNMSHAPHEWVRTITSRIRQISARLDQHVAILLDTQGPAIRTGDLPNKLNLKIGDLFTFTVRGHKSEEAYSVDTNYDDLVNDIKVGDVVLVDNGVIRMVVREKNSQELKCEVLTEGELGSRRHINLPGIKVNLPALTEKDLKDIDVGIECGVDFIALSFVREANDVMVLRQVLESREARNIFVIAKIEDQSAVRNIGEIIDVADAVMVARGDLGIECPFEELPIIQRRIVKKCVTSGKPVIVATHLLESMIHNPIPTRAEITDASNAVFEQTDAIMLSGETTVGKYPIECVKVLDKVAQRIERSGNLAFHSEILLNTEQENVISSAIVLANTSKADGICLFTRKGQNAGIASALRPLNSPIFAFTPDRLLMRRLALRFGIYPLYLDFGGDQSETNRAAEQILRERNLVGIGSKLVFVTSHMEDGNKIRSVELRTLR